ncbi:helix-turn-helix domain-containing protein [Streptomyces millisiae]|uniref:Helix-turn-helix domain-containing protein n=1 Tax=Streptomyces millisiae TaxID=3075542 RepID=A0ABU2LML5_9ACTN|nr:helix-turn-helix domain-containing protein [Streptomyces sp. DSM 44918]MDT0318826.1 helix-turn-helix domain-containing protein [Streptomyces sp. DSM 44918]
MTMSALIPTAMYTDHQDDFLASITIVDVGLAQISAMSYPSITSVRRTPKMIRRSDPEYLQLSLTVRGQMRLAQSRNEVAFGNGQLVLYDSSYPFDGFALPGREEAVGQIVAQLPRRLVPVQPDRLTALLSTALPSDWGFGEMLRRFLVQVTTRPDEFGPADGPRLATVFIDLLAAAIGQRLDEATEPSADRHPHALYLTVRDFVRAHLSEPSLTPDAIAVAHHVSTRSLHRLFQRHGTTVAAFVRRERLERARRDLADPLLAEVPVSAIAQRLGFVRPADFTRSFKAAFGVPPRAYRDTALRNASARKAEQ